MSCRLDFFGSPFFKKGATGLSPLQGSGFVFNSAALTLDDGENITYNGVGPLQNVGLAGLDTLILQVAGRWQIDWTAFYSATTITTAGVHVTLNGSAVQGSGQNNPSLTDSLLVGQAIVIAAASDTITLQVVPGGGYTMTFPDRSLPPFVYPNATITVTLIGT